MSQSNFVVLPSGLKRAKEEFMNVQIARKTVEISLSASAPVVQNAVVAAPEKNEQRVSKERFYDLVDDAFSLLQENKKNRGAVVKESGQADFFHYILFELEKKHKNDPDFFQLKEVSKAAVATAMRKMGEINLKAKERVADEALQIWLKESMNQIRVFGNSGEIAEIIFSELKPATTQSMIVMLVKEYVCQFDRQKKLDLFYLESKKTINFYFTLYSGELFKKGETSDDRKRLIEKIRLLSNHFTFIGKSVDVDATILRALYDKREEAAVVRLRAQKNNQTLDDASAREFLPPSMINRKKGGSKSSRRHAKRYPGGNCPEPKKGKGVKKQKKGK